MELQTFILSHGFSLSIVCDNIFTNNVITATINRGESKVQITSLAVAGLLGSYSRIKSQFADMMFSGTVRMPIYGDRHIFINIELTKRKDVISGNRVVDWRLIFHNSQTSPNQLICTMDVCRQCIKRFMAFEDMICNAMYCWSKAKSLILLHAQNALQCQGYLRMEDDAKDALKLLMKRGAYINNEILDAQPIRLQEEIRIWCTITYRPGSAADSEPMSDSESEEENDVFAMIAADKI